MSEPKIGIRAASKHTGFTTAQISYAAKTGRLRAYKSSPYGPWFFTESDLDAWLAGMLNTPKRRKRRVSAGR